MSDHQGSHIITRPLAPENYPETSSANVICVNQRPRSPETNILDLGVCKLLVSTHCTRRQARAAAKRRLQFDCSNKVNRRRDGQSMPRVQQARSQNVCIRREGSRSMMRPFSNRFCVSRRSGKTTHSNGDTHAGKYKKALGYLRRVWKCKRTPVGRRERQRRCEPRNEAADVRLRGLWVSEQIGIASSRDHRVSYIDFL